MTHEEKIQYMRFAASLVGFGFSPADLDLLVSLYDKINGWVFVSGFALHNAQFRGQMLMAKLAQIPCYLLVRFIKQKV